jgi:soluble lytic murein transglycosylase-like protein
MISILATILIALCSALPVAQAEAHAAAALEASKATAVPVEYLLAIAYVESRYNPLALSRMQCPPDGGECKRVTGLWAGEKRPPGARKTWYCGVMQVGGDVTWERCLELRDVRLNYLVGAQHLVEWRNDPHCRRLPEAERMVCALRGYNGGYKSIKSRASKYARTVLHLAARIRGDVARRKHSES